MPLLRDGSQLFGRDSRKDCPTWHVRVHHCLRPDYCSLTNCHSWEKQRVSADACSFLHYWAYELEWLLHYVFVISEYASWSQEYSVFNGRMRTNVYPGLNGYHRPDP